MFVIINMINFLVITLFSNENKYIDINYIFCYSLNGNFNKVLELLILDLETYTILHVLLIIYYKFIYI